MKAFLLAMIFVSASSAFAGDKLSCVLSATTINDAVTVNKAAIKDKDGRFSMSLYDRKNISAFECTVDVTPNGTALIVLDGPNGAKAVSAGKLEVGTLVRLEGSDFTSF